MGRGRKKTKKPTFNALKFRPIKFNQKNFFSNGDFPFES